MNTVQRSAGLTFAGLLMALIGYAVLHQVSGPADPTKGSLLNVGVVILCLGAIIGVIGAVLTVLNALRQ